MLAASVGPAHEAAAHQALAHRRAGSGAVGSHASQPAGTGTFGTGGTPAPSGEAAPAPPPGARRPGSGARFRIAGCRSDGAGAYRHGPRDHEVAIGFDDGPAADTPAFVTMLERNDARATFFLIGDQLRSSDRALLRRELRDGDAIGDHTFTHPILTRSGNAYAQLRDTAAAIRELSGYWPCVFRPPYGAYDAPVLGDARALGMATVLWNVDPSDYELPGSREIERRVLAQVQPGSIIISHDGGGARGQTLAAYPGIIAALRARGYRIVTIPQLLGFRPVYVHCVRLCDGIGVPFGRLPPGAILERAP